MSWRDGRAAGRDGRVTGRDGAWRAPPAVVRPSPDAADVWRIRLDRPPERPEAVLSPDERARAARFHVERDRLHYAAAHAALRRILGAYLDRDPAALAFAVGPRGKPRLADDPATGEPARLRFNLSHAGELALLAVADGREVGVDVERERPLDDLDRIAERHFSTAEQAALRGLRLEERHAAFFRCWSRKEAFVKALGLGLGAPLDAFDVSLGPADEARLLASRRAPDDAARWSLVGLEVGAGYAAALAYERPPDGPRAVVRVRCWDYPG